MKLPYEEFVNRLYERGSQVRIVTAQGVHASLQENFRSSWRNWKGGLLTRCGHQLRCPNPAYALAFFFFFQQPSSCTLLFPLPTFFSIFSFFFLSFHASRCELTLSIFSSRLEIFHLYHSRARHTFCASISSLFVHFDVIVT